MTMKPSRSQLVERILDFMSVIHECYSATNFANDRAVYSVDMVMAMGWVVELRSGADVQEVFTKISSHETSKHFGDYWRQGSWGESEAAALKKLREGI